MAALHPIEPSGPFWLAASSSTPLSVMIVEDDSLHAEICLQMLRVHGMEHRVTSVGTRKDIQRLVASDQSWDCVLLDLHLPDGEGEELIGDIMSHHPDVPIIIMTATDNDAVALQLLKAGAEDYLVKGQFNQRLLIRSISYAIERKRTRIQATNLKIQLETERMIAKRQREFIDMISQEFLAPIAIANASLQRLDQLLEALEHQGARKHLNRLGHAHQRLAILTDSAIAFLSLEDGLIRFQPASFNLKPMIENLCAYYTEMNGGCVVRHSIDNLPDRWHGDHVLIEQMLSLLISTMIGASHDRSALMIRGKIRADQLLIQVENNDYTSERSGSGQTSGVGLYLVRKLAHLHSGAVHVVSYQGVGTVVTLTLPADGSTTTS